MTSILRVNEIEIRTEHALHSAEFGEMVTNEMKRISERRFEIEVSRPFKDVEDSVIQGIMENKANGLLPVIIRFYDEDEFAFQLPGFIGSEI